MGRPMFKDAISKSVYINRIEGVLARQLSGMVALTAKKLWKNLPGNRKKRSTRRWIY